MKAHKRERTTYKQERMLMFNINQHLDLASQIVERAYPKDDVATLRTYQKEIWKTLVDVVAKDKCFYFLTQRSS